MKINKIKSDQYAKDIEYAKDLLLNNVSMSEILSKTNLNEQDIRDIIRNRDTKYNHKSKKIFT